MREHIFISEFAITDQNQPEITFDMRKVGTLVEIEPAICADGSTVEFNFMHELHPAPPETRGAHFRDPASGKRFAMPATDFHALKTTCGLSMTRGSTKLTSLHQPTGRDATGKLWATFLKCDVVPHIGKPNRKTESKAVEVPNGGELETKSFRVPADFLTRTVTHRSQDTPPAPADPFEEPAQPPRTRRNHHSAPQSFRDLDLSFPEGSSASFNPATSLLIVRNTPENLALIEAWVDEVVRAQPKTTVLTTHIFQAPGPLLRRLTAQTARMSNHRSELDELLAAVKTGAAQSLGTHRIETKPGGIARTQQGVQHTALSDVHIRKDGKPEIITETRNVGFKAELEGTINPDGQSADVHIATEFHTAPPLEHRERILDTQGRRLEFPLTDFHLSNLATTLTIPSGTTRLLSLHKLVGKPEFEQKDILQAIFITCDVLHVDK